MVIFIFNFAGDLQPDPNSVKVSGSFPPPFAEALDETSYEI